MHLKTFKDAIFKTFQVFLNVDKIVKTVMQEIARYSMFAEYYLPKRGKKTMGEKCRIKKLNFRGVNLTTLLRVHVCVCVCVCAWVCVTPFGRIFRYLWEKSLFSKKNLKSFLLLQLNIFNPHWNEESLTSRLIVKWKITIFFHWI